MSSRSTPSKSKSKTKTKTKTNTKIDYKYDDDEFTDVVFIKEKKVNMTVFHINGKLLKKPRSISRQHVSNENKHIIYTSKIDKDEINSFEPIRNEQIKYVASLLYLIHPALYSSSSTKTKLTETVEKITETVEKITKREDIYDKFYDEYIYPAIIKLLYYLKQNVNLLLFRDSSNKNEIIRRLNDIQNNIFTTIQ